MERLTEFHGGILGLSTEEVKEGYDRYSAYSRLAEYEDTGLTPQEINHYVAVHKEIWKKKIETIRKDREFWESEAKKWCDQVFEYRLQQEGGK